jgi:hypothetical protein
MAVFDISFFSDALGRIAPLTAIVPAERPNHYGGNGKPFAGPFRSLYIASRLLRHTYGLAKGLEDRAACYGTQYCGVMPAGENGFYLDDTIRRANYSKLLCEDLINFTAQCFPLSSRREDTTIGGFSMGGYGA